MALKVLKFGGTSLASIERIEAVSGYIGDQVALDNQLVVVVSAMGKMTDELKGMAYKISDSPDPRELDMLLTAGERIAMALLSIALQKRGIPSQSFTGSQSGILTDGTHGNARIERILGDRLRSALSENKVAVVAGFQGMNLETKNITTLGRGGSDLTAVAMADTLMADSCEIFTDVLGVYSADPLLVKNAKLISELHWDEMVLLAEAGAGVLHARAAVLARERGVPIRIASSFDFSSPGTTVGDVKRGALSNVCFVSCKSGLELHRYLLEQPPSSDFIAAQIKNNGNDSNDLFCSSIYSNCRVGGGNFIAIGVPALICAMDLAIEKSMEKTRYKNISRTKNIAVVTINFDDLSRFDGRFGKEWLALNKVELMYQQNDQSLTIVIDEKNLAEIVASIHDDILN